MPFAKGDKPIIFTLGELIVHFPGNPLSDKSKWAVLFSLLREAGMKDRQSLCFLWLVFVAENKVRQAASLLLLRQAVQGGCVQSQTGKNKSWITLLSALCVSYY